MKTRLSNKENGDSDVPGPEIMSGNDQSLEIKRILGSPEFTASVRVLPQGGTLKLCGWKYSE